MDHIPTDMVLAALVVMKCVVVTDIGECYVKSRLRSKGRI